MELFNGLANNSKVVLKQACIKALKNTFKSTAEGHHFPGGV
jgi:hypothetical protein